MHDTHDHHDHGHDHDHDDPFHVQPTRELNVDDMDPANRSLAEALRISFGILKWAVVVLVVVFFGYGAYNQVQTGQVGVLIRFGAAVGNVVEEGGEDRFVVRVLKPDVYFTWPEPIEKIILVPTVDQRLVIGPGVDTVTDPITGKQTETPQTGFWFEQRGDEKNVTDLDKLTPMPGGLRPGKDGSLITADRNLVHGKWQVTFRIREDDAATFALNVGSTERDESLRRAALLVRNATERAILHVVASTTVEQFVTTKTSAAEIQRLAQESLRRMETGITIAKVESVVVTPPLQVRSTFNDVSKANNTRKQKQEDALKYQSNKLQSTAGQGYERLIEAIDAYRAARAVDDKAAIAAAQAQLDQMLADEQSLGALRIGGQVARIVTSAEADKKELVNAVSAEVEAFKAQQEKFATDPQLRRITMRRMWFETLRNVFQKDHELFRAPPNAEHIYIELGRNTQVRSGNKNREE